ncbi:toxic anion resistance protein [Sphingomonas sp. PAMC26645]|uniref:toxic anion resistance protein n=1 Tax=Sphingomonas sp. PAMC26645 TaxID=2565555 RepID=UPI00109DB395|nr:toxic anion resistance protein [Sphingomonas sp. PAMC26645]QCB42560.1 toxic anion resistance protein [Sphingomonas sp. PAMC26645]
MLSIEPPAPFPPASTAGAIDVPITEEARTRLRASADRYVEELVSLPPDGPDFAIKADQLSNVGRREVSALAGLSSRLVARSGGSSAPDGVGPALHRLREIMEDLDPARDGDLLAPRRILGIIRVGSGIGSYFRRYEPAQKAIDGILRTLAAGRDSVLRDNIAIDGDRRRMWALMEDLEVAIQGSRRLDDGLERAAAKMELSAPEKGRALRERALFRTRQRITDLLTQMAVSLQGYMALGVVRRTNEELISGIERASTTTIAVLHTAVAVAQALAGQRLVLNRISAIDGSAAPIIEGAGRPLPGDRNRIVQPARRDDLDALQRAFAEVRSTLDEVDALKRARGVA